jgi:cytoskeletal protein RodZ
MASDVLTSPATPARNYDARRLGRERLRARRRRIRTLRRRVAAVLAVAFVALWIGIYAQLATGNDPALVASATRKATTSTTTAATTTGATSAATTSSGSASSGTASSTPVTTRAS